MYPVKNTIKKISAGFVKRIRRLTALLLLGGGVKVLIVVYANLSAAIVAVSLL
jgi:hypothetical protein